MFASFGGYPRYHRTGGLVSRAFRIMFGLIFLYLGVNMAGDLVRMPKSTANQSIKNAVYKYNSVSIVSSVVGDVANAISDSFEKDGTPTNPNDINARAQSIAGNLEVGFRKQMPAVNSAVDDILASVVAPFKQAINETIKKSKHHK